MKSIAQTCDEESRYRGVCSARVERSVWYVNGSKFPINSLSGAIEPFGAERLELLKGPASILYGQAAPGGLINVVTKRPTAAPFGSVEVELGSFDRRQVAVDLAGPMSDSWGYRVTALTRDSDNRRTGATTATDADAFTGRAGLLYLFR